MMVKMIHKTLFSRYLQLNPTHCVPTMVDDNLVLWESRAIITYLVNQYSPQSSLYPKDPQKRAIVDRLLQFDMGSIYKNISDYLVMKSFF